MAAVIKFDFLEHYYIEKKERYESILCELINRSPAFNKIGGGAFQQISVQNEGQPDVIAPASGYSLDFKMMISQTLAEFRNLSKPRFVEISPGVKAQQAGRKVTQEAVIFPSAIRNITEEQLIKYRKENDRITTMPEVSPPKRQEHWINRLNTHGLVTLTSGSLTTRRILPVKWIV